MGEEGREGHQADHTTRQHANKGGQRDQPESIFADKRPERRQKPGRRVVGAHMVQQAGHGWAETGRGASVWCFTLSLMPVFSCGREGLISFQQ
ncbi:hypothetical protein Amal_00348 [Acetobacter malorum]|uniref:Uncharacterized protein n=1 Tax=Acetobacter malorum TaxID=178901 RepID=A0A177GEW1_9PROT|nr:hypothetical protein Amal_00348 [Acetobacter malorum]